MYKISLITFTVLILLVSICHGGEALTNHNIDPSVSQPDTAGNQDLILMAVEKQKKLLPKRVNTFITWTDIALEGNRSVVNKYLINSDELYLPLSWALFELKTLGESKTIRKIKKLPILRFMLKSGYRLVYRYYDKENNLLHQFSVELKDLE